MNDLRARPLLSSPALCTRSLIRRAVYGICGQNLWESSLHKSLEEVSWQDLWERYLQISRQDLFTKSPVQAPYNTSTLRKIYVRDLLARSLQQISVQCLVQGLQKRCPGKTSVQDLYQRSLGKALEKISLITRDIHRRSLGSQSKSSVQALCARSLSKIAALFTRLHKISCGGLLAWSLHKNSIRALF